MDEWKPMVIFRKMRDQQCPWLVSFISGNVPMSTVTFAKEYNLCITVTFTIMCNSELTKAQYGDLCSMDQQDLL